MTIPVSVVGTTDPSVWVNMSILYEIAWSTHDSWVAPISGLSTFPVLLLSNQTCDKIRVEVMRSSPTLYVNNVYCGM